MGLAVLVWYRHTIIYPYWLITTGGLITGGLVYFISLRVLKVPEIHSIPIMVRGVMHRK